MKFKKLQNKLKSGGSKPGKKCEKCCISKCKGGSACFAEGKKCSKCGGLSHITASKLCPDKGSKQSTTRKVEEAEESDTDGSEESCGRIVESHCVPVGKLQGSQKKDSIFCKLKATGGKDTEIRATIKLATYSEWFLVCIPL